MSSNADRTLAKAWRIPEPLRRPGPKASLTLTGIVNAGIELGDAEGAEAMSLGRIAGVLNVTTNALYRYVDSRDQLLALICDQALGEPSALTGEDWPALVRDWAFALRTRYEVHSWLATVPVRVPLTPHALAWLDALLRALESSGLDEEGRLRAAALLDGFVRSSAVAAEDLTGPPVVDVPVELPGLLADRGLDAVGALIQRGIYAPTPGAPIQADFEFGLACILAGLQELSR